MTTVNIHEAKTHLSRFIDAVESGAESEVVIARNGRPVARLTALEAPRKQKVKFGLAKGKFTVPDNIDALNPEIERMFYGDDD